jgi:hypothetical protein
MKFDELKKQNNEQRERFGLPLIKISTVSTMKQVPAQNFEEENAEVAGSLV